MPLNMALKREQTRTKSEYPDAHLVLRSVTLEGDRVNYHLQGYADKAAYDLAVGQKSDGYGLDSHNAVIYENHGCAERVKLVCDNSESFEGSIRASVQAHLLTLPEYNSAIEVE
jgi:hypothetical protein